MRARSAWQTWILSPGWPIVAAPAAKMTSGSMIDALGGPSAEPSLSSLPESTAWLEHRHPPKPHSMMFLLQALNPTLKAAKFRKSGMNYHRRLGETVQVVNVQVSHGSTGMEKRFYINAGVAFDALCELAGVPVLERPKEYQCDRCGTRDRLEKLIPGAQHSGKFALDRIPLTSSGPLRGFIEQLVGELDRIDGLPAYRSHRWFDRFRPAGVTA